jgi:hypothetical protein
LAHFELNNLSELSNLLVGMQLILGCRFLKLSLQRQRFPTVVEEASREERQRAAQDARSQELMHEKFLAIPYELPEAAADLRACVEQMVHATHLDPPS